MAAATSRPIDAPPKAGQAISHQGNDYTTIKEGLGHILVPHGISTSTDPRIPKEDVQKQQVFYNPIQQFNRDLSVLAIKVYSEDVIARRRDKHEKAAKKIERKKQKLANDSRNQEPSLAEQADDVPSKKRGLDHDDSTPAEPAAKRMKSLGAGAETEGLGAGAEALDNVGVEAEAGENIGAGAQTGEVVGIGAEVPPSGADDVQPPRPAWKPAFTILDALSATGLRALRYASEIPFTTSVTANDMSHKATQSIALNIKHNKLEDKIQVNTSNAIAYMYSLVEKKGYDVIDLDPYGTAAPFIDSALQAINDDGLLCVTCTDSAIFASHGYLEKTYSQYGGLPFKGDACHEGGVRLILHAIATSAGRYGMSIEPLLSLSIDYYIRVFVRVRKAPNEVKFLAGKTMIVYHCDTGCGAWTTQFLARNKAVKNKNGTEFYKHSFAQGPSANEHCKHCGFKTHLSGPMYGGPLHNVEFIKRLLAHVKDVDRETYPTVDRIEGMLRTALEEITFGIGTSTDQVQETEQLDPIIPKRDPAEVDHHPFFFVPSAVSRIIHCSAPSAAAVRGALRHAGFRVTMSHCKPGSMKTDASWKDIWHIMLEWVRQKAPLKNALKKDSAGYAIMSKGSAHQPSAIENGGQPASEADAEAPREPPSYLNVKFEVKFDEKLGKDHDRGKYVRYQLAPRENWGPMARAK